MSFTDREWWGLIHGMVLGALFLLAFTGGDRAPDHEALRNEALAMRPRTVRTSRRFEAVVPMYGPR